jgi:hypothetical protein
MAVESGARSSNTLSGELRSRPLAVLLAGACDRTSSGTFTFTHEGRRETLTMRLGKIASVRTTEPIAYLGGILYELGAIDMPTLNKTLREVASTKRLHGDILVERGILTRERVEEGLTEQTFRRVHYLFSLPETTTWTFRDDVDELAGKRDEDRPCIETWPAIWRGLRDQPGAAHVRRTLAKIEGGIHLKDLRAVARFGLTPEEMAVCERLHAQPSTLGAIVTTSPLVFERTETLVYLLALARCIVRVETQPVGPIELGVEGVRERARRIDGEDATTTLGLPHGASLDAARAAFFRLARLWHPDKIPASLDEVRAECRQVFLRIGEAHRALTDASSRITIESLVGGAYDVAANDSTRPPATSTLRDADAALSRLDVEAADTIARSLTSAGADGPSARAILAWCATGAGTSSEPAVLEAAVATLDKILTGDPDCVRALLYRGHVQKRLGRTDAALRDYRKVMRIDPRHIDAQREVRLHEMRQSDTPAASVASDAAPAPAPAAPTAPARVSAADTSVRSGLRRLIARVAGS